METLLESVTIDATDATSESTDGSLPKAKSKELTTPLTATEPNEISYDPPTVFLLELATSLAIRDEESMRALSPELVGYCTEVLRQRKVLHPILIERTLVYLMALKNRGHQTVIPSPAKLTSGR